MQSLQDALIAFAKERDWEQFQSPKNLSMAIAVEASELMEHFQWLTEEESKKLQPEKREQAAFELADIYLYTLLMAKRMNIDLDQYAERKIRINHERYPVEKAKGRANKYSDYLENSD